MDPRRWGAGGGLTVPAGRRRTGGRGPRAGKGGAWGGGPPPRGVGCWASRSSGGGGGPRGGAGAAAALRKGGGVALGAGAHGWLVGGSTAAVVGSPGRRPRKCPSAAAITLPY